MAEALAHQDGAGRRPARFILSAGRTGTVFLETFLNTHGSGVTAVHEPSPTRYQMMLANLRNDLGVGGGLLRRWVASRYRDRAARAGDAYVEINPFLCPMTDLLPGAAGRLHVVHMVREPASWARSICLFKGSARTRWAIDLVPFAKPYPAPRPDGWRRLDEVEKALWRWRWCNERILALAPACESFTTVRYEDLFGDDRATRTGALDRVVATLDVPLDRAPGDDAMSSRLNPAPRRPIAVDRDAVGRICGPLARDLGYDA